MAEPSPGRVPSGVMLLDAANRLRRADTLLRRRAASRLGLKDSEFQAVQHLVAMDAEHSPVRPKDLAELLGVTGGAASMVVDRLVGRDLAVRAKDPDDGRGRVVHPTQTARDGITAAYGDMPAALRSVLDTVPEEEAHRVVALADRVQRIVDGAAEPPTDLTF